MVLKMKIKFLSFFSLFLCLSNIVFSKSLLNEDLKNSLEFLYSFNPELKYERNILRAKDELMPQALSEFRPEIKGYYQKGKVHTNSHGFNITSDGIRTETNKGVTIIQDIFDGGSSLSNLKVAKNTIFAFTRKNNKKSINALISNNFYKEIEKKEYIKFKYENRK